MTGVCVWSSSSAGSQVEVLSRKGFLASFPPGGGPPPVRGSEAR